jgi:mannose/fructose/N-acetylgalactosamine-specific phosphotransferase system component IIC
LFFEISLTAIAGGLLCLDRIFFQVMVSRPVVSASVIGLLLGDPYVGMITGALIELIWIDRLPVGTVVPPNDTVSAVLISAAVILAGRSLGAVSKEVIALGIILLLPTALAGQIMDIWIIRGNDKIARAALKTAADGDIDGVSRLHIRALLRTYLINTVFIFTALGIGVYALQTIYSLIPPAVLKSLVYVYLFLPILGVAVALNTIHLRGMLPVFSGIFLIVMIIFEIV